jgi:hypothetical protein
MFGNHDHTGARGEKSICRLIVRRHDAEDWTCGAEIVEHFGWHGISSGVWFKDRNENICRRKDVWQARVLLIVEENQILELEPIPFNLEQIAPLALGDHHDAGIGLALTQSVGQFEKDSRVMLESKRPGVEHDLPPNEIMRTCPVIVPRSNGHLRQRCPIGDDRHDVRRDVPSLEDF